MKTLFERDEPEFKPLVVTLVLETPEEVQALYAVANFSQRVAQTVAPMTGNSKRVPVSLLAIESVLFGIWKTLKNAGVKSGAAGDGVAS
jgi:hypothetical protein